MKQATKQQAHRISFWKLHTRDIRIRYYELSESKSGYCVKKPRRGVIPLQGKQKRFTEILENPEKYPLTYK